VPSAQTLMMEARDKGQPTSTVDDYRRMGEEQEQVSNQRSRA
jgi:hypothetical protein